MKHLLYSFMLLFCLFTYHSPAYAAGNSSSGDSTVYDSIGKGGEKNPAAPPEKMENQSTGLFPLLIKFIGSLALVIALMFVLFKFLFNRNKRLAAGGPVLPLAGHMVGQNRSVQVLLIGQTIYILGVGENINLIRSISKGEEYQQLMESYENQAEGLTSKWPLKDQKMNWNSVFSKYIRKMEQANDKEPHQ